MKKGLGRGLDSLFGDYPEEEVKPTGGKTDGKVEKVVVNEPKEIEIGLIDRNPDQPRKAFDEESLAELANSIKSFGVVQPIIVKENEGRYIIIAGERRWRAARMAGLKKIPCLVREYSKQEVSEIAIIENLQREDLNPIESARAIKNLIDEYHLTQDEVADKIGKSRPAVTNTIRLLTLPEAIITLVEQNKISAGHARALLSLESSVKQKEVALQIIERGLSVRETEKLIHNIAQGQKLSAMKKPEKSIELKEFENQIKRTLLTKVQIKGNDNKGRIIIEYYNKEDLNRIFDVLNK